MSIFGQMQTSHNLHSALVACSRFIVYYYMVVFGKDVALLFGYVLPARCELKVRDFETYRASYCGVCKQLGKSYGVFSRFLLNYDLVLVSLLADALSGETGRCCVEGCFANPLARRSTLHGTKGLRLASDGLVMLSWHKLRDNLDDERLPKRVICAMARPFLGRMYKKAAAKKPHLAQLMAEQMARQAQLEAAGCSGLDEICEPTALMCAAVFAEAAHSEGQRQVLHRLGLFAGQIVYLLDAAEDYADDTKKGCYNVFMRQGLSAQQAAETARARCRMAAGEIALCYNLLNITQHKAILDNIFFLGLPHAIEMAGVKQRKRRPGHGQIEGL